jgi:hypothetical protein
MASGIRGAEAGHEFSQLIGIDDRTSGNMLFNTNAAVYGVATPSDLRIAFGPAAGVQQAYPSRLLKNAESRVPPSSLMNLS